MCCKLPVFSKCCFCISLRPGLLILAYLRLVAATLEFLLVLSAVRVELGAKDLAILFSMLGLHVANLIFSAIFIVGLLIKDHKLLQQYYSFNIFYVAVFILLSLCNFGLQLIYHGAAMVFSNNIFVIIAFVLNALIQLYFIAVIKSVILKIQAQEKTTHRNTNGEARVVLDMPIAKEQDVKCDVEHTESECEEEIRKKSLFPVEELKRLQEESDVQNTVE